MEVLMLKHDGRCKWLENKVLTGLMPMSIRMAANPFAQKLYYIVDWISNDRGRVGVDLKWFKSLGLPAVKSYAELPAGNDFKVINTGYDSIVSEEHTLREHGVEIIDKPCPFVRRLRSSLETADPAYQYVLLCSASHIIIKNFVSIFPRDMILVQPDNYREKIAAQQNGKPLRIVPYVTYVKRDADEILEHVNQAFPERNNDKVDMSCMWINSKASPILEIEGLTAQELHGVSEALLITTADSRNTSMISLEKALQKRNLKVTRIGSLRDFLRHERRHPRDKVLLVRSPIPNGAEAPILVYIDKGLLAACRMIIGQNSTVRRVAVWSMIKVRYLRNLIFREQAKREAEREGLLRSSAIARKAPARPAS